MKETCAVRKSCFDTLVTEMEKLAETIQGWLQLHVIGFIINIEPHRVLR